MASPTAPPDILRHLSITSSPSVPHVLTIAIDSNVVEVTVALLFDVVLLSLIENLCQAICAHHNLYRVYDSPSGVLPLRARRIALFGDGLIGVPWLSSLLTVVLAVVVVSNIVVGFAVTGRSEPVYHAVEYAAVVGTALDHAVLVVDPAVEIGDDDDNSGREPTYLSSRLVALKKMDYCQTCNYTHCTLFAYAFRNEQLGRNLVHVGEATESDSATCVSAHNFRDARVMAIPTRVKQKDGWCGIESMDVDYGTVANNNSTSISNSGESRGNEGMSLGIGHNLRYEYCHFEILSPRCVRRPKHDTVCATIGRHLRDPIDTTERYLMLMSIPRSEDDDNSATQAAAPSLYDLSRIDASVGHRLDNDTWERYMETAALMAAVGLGPGYMLQLMPFASFSANQTLLLRAADGRTRNVSDVDLRVGLPAVVAVCVTAGVLVVAAAVTWGLFVHRQGRGGCNAFASVTELVEVMGAGPGGGAAARGGRKKGDWDYDMGVDDMEDADDEGGWFPWCKKGRGGHGGRAGRAVLGRENGWARVAVSHDGDYLEVRGGEEGGEGVGKEVRWEAVKRRRSASTTGSGRAEWEV